ncbi:MAG: PEP/pyruvate-binding domain-containing protein [Desulfobacteraceae bacterium]|jgi:pyruvate,water dikinase
MGIKNLFTYWTNQAFFPTVALKEKYAAFKSLLEQDKRAHELMAELEQVYHEQVMVDFSAVEKKYHALSECVSTIVSNLDRMHPSRYDELNIFFRKIDGYARHLLFQALDTGKPPFCLQIPEISESMVSMVGEKTLNLAMISKRSDIPTPRGFVVTTNAFYRFIHHNRLKPAMDDILSTIDIHNIDTLDRKSDELKKLIYRSEVPPDVASQIFEAFAAVFEAEKAFHRAAVRSSAVGEDSRASFAGQYKTILNVGKEDLLDAYKAVLASKYSPEALVYRINYGLTDMETPMAVMVVEMIAAVASGVMYTQALDDVTSDIMEVHAVFGLGEPLVQGEITPDIFKVHKREKPEIAGKKSALKKQRMVVNQQGDTRVERLRDDLQTAFCIDDAAVLTLAAWGMVLENFGEEPRDVEWCMDEKGRLYLLQSRPLKTGDQSAPDLECRFDEIDNRILLTGGDRAASGVASGPVFVAGNASDLTDLPDNAVLVTRTASASYVKVMDKVIALISETGSIAGHFASVAREFGIPTMVNARAATRQLRTGDTVTVYADEGIVYDGTVHALLKNPCVRKRPIADSPFTRKLNYIMGFVSPLKLIDPHAAEFTPGGCRSLHDIIRFAHEAATREMFSIGDRAFGKSRGTKKLVTKIPMLIYLMDVGGGLADDAVTERTVESEQIHCEPFRAVWKGLNHPGIRWGEFTHFNWAEYDKIVMSGGIISAESAQLASYAVLSKVYLNLNLKFGYHFVILDTLCSGNAEENHILFRFNGGGGDDHGRSLRADFLQAVLQRLQFEVSRTSDLVDARFSDAAKTTIMEKLDLLGRLLGATRLMDMYLSEAAQVGPFVEAFFNGQYHFASIDE